MLKYYEKLKEKKFKEYDTSISEIEQIKRWFAFEYTDRLLHIYRCNYLGVKPDESEFSLQKEAYEKEQRLRFLIGADELGPIKYKDIL